MASQKVFVCYLPGVDVRRLGPENTPYLTELRTTCPATILRTLPSSELLSTTLTGQYPHEHGIWQARLRQPAPPTLKSRLACRLPDLLVTTVQCAIHFLTGACDVPTLPYRRRRRLEFARLKFRLRATTEDLLARLGDTKSIVGLLGPQTCRYDFTDRFDDIERVLEHSATGAHDLEILQFHALDQLGHWHLDTPEKVRDTYRRTDDLVRRFHAKCQARGITMAVLSDHGQEAVHDFLDLRGRLEELGLPEEEYTAYVQAIMARFWFHTDRARDKILGLLHQLDQGQVLTWRDMHRYNVCFEDDRFGEVYFLCHPGSMFFPHDFHGAIANFFFGLRDKQQRRRLRTARHLAYHGYLPQYDSEKDILVLLQPDYVPVAAEADLIDVAPTLLDLIGHPQPDWMRGAPAFARSA